MMLELFDIQDKRVIPHANVYQIPELRKIIEKFPEEYLSVLSYIFFTTCPDGSNPYINLDEATREEVIIADLEPLWDLEDTAVILAQEKLKRLFETPSLRAFMGAKKALDRVATYLAETEITDGKDGSSMTIDRYMSKLSEYRKAYKDAENDLKEEQAKVRGGMKIRYDFQPGYVDTKADRKDDE